MNKYIFISFILLASLVFKTNSLEACCHKPTRSYSIETSSCNKVKSKNECYSSHVMEQGKIALSCNFDKEGNCDETCNGNQCCCHVVPVGFIESNSIEIQWLEGQVNIVNFWNYQPPLSFSIFETIWQPPQDL